jgi:DNA polymerase-1
MIYLVTKEKSLFDSSLYKNITVEESLEMIKGCNILQYDSETGGIDCHLSHLLCIQIGNKTKDFQIVIDAITIDIRLYKDVLENTLLIGHNIKFDLKFLYNYNIIPRKVYDTMIVEQLLFLGYPKGIKRYSLAAIANERLGVDIDKSIRGQIIWRGLDETTIEYSANDVKYLEDIMLSQKEDYTKYGMTKGAILECNAVPSIAYLEWCGIKLDENKWKAKMEKDLINLNKSIEDLNKFILSLPNSNTIKIKVTVKTRRVVVPIYTIDKQLDLFYGFNTDPVFNINWASSEHVIAVAKFLGFDTKVKDKKTGEDKDSVMEKHLSNQKGINDEFLKLYFNYAGYAKVVSSFGQGHLDSINPITGRLHTEYHQLGASSSRMSCGSDKKNTDLQKYKKLPKGSCKYQNMQQLPHDAETRACFTTNKGNLFCSCDYSAQEGRMQAEVYNEPVLIDMYSRGLDSHSVNAKIFFKEELRDIDVKDVKKLRPDLRQAAKAPFFALSYGGSYSTLMSSLGISEEEAKKIVVNYEEGYKATMEFAKKGEAFVKNNGYIIINPTYGHRLWWWDHKEWLERQKTFTPEFWEDYRENHKGTSSSIAQMVKMHFQASSKYGRLARNAPSQGSSSIMTKLATIDLFNWIVDNGYFSKILLVNITHDKYFVVYKLS